MDHVACESKLRSVLRSSIAQETGRHSGVRSCIMPGAAHGHTVQELDVGTVRSVVRSWTCGLIHAQETGLQSGVRPCTMSGLPTHLLQELNVGTVE